MNTGMTNLGSGGEAGGVSDADRAAAANDLQPSAASGVRPTGGQSVDADDEAQEVDPTGG